MKKIAFLGLFGLFSAIQLIQCDDVLPNMQFYAKGDKFLTVYSPKQDQDIAAQKEYILKQARARNASNNDSVLIINDRTFLTDSFKQGFPQESEEFLKREFGDVSGEFTALHKQAEGIQKYNVAFDYFFDDNCTIELATKVVLAVAKGFDDEIYENFIDKLSELFEGFKIATKLIDLSPEKITTFNFLKKILLNLCYGQAIVQAEQHPFKRIFICVNADEVNYITKLLEGYQWINEGGLSISKTTKENISVSSRIMDDSVPVSTEGNTGKFNPAKLNRAEDSASIVSHQTQDSTSRVKQKPSIFSWKTMSAIGTGIASCGYLAAVAYKNNFFGWDSWLHYKSLYLAARLNFRVLLRRLLGY